MLEYVLVRACAVEKVEDLETFLIALFDNPENPVQGIEIQVSLNEPDEQDKELGMDGYCLCLMSGATFYGGLSSCILRGNNLTLELSDEAVAVSGVEGFFFQLELSEKQTVSLKAGLERMFKNVPRAPTHLILE